MGRVKGDPNGNKLVAYYRVSTKGQGDSGLGLDAQREAVNRLALASDATVVREFTEVETGTKATLANRPKLAEAIGYCRRSGATLAIAKLDRLARNVAFLSSLMESGVEFVAADNPTANRLTVHILAAVAEAEAKTISERTKAALAAYKARGGKLGGERPECRNLSDEARRKGRDVASAKAQAKAREAYESLMPDLVRMRDAGLSLRAIAHELNAAGEVTSEGKPWNQVLVMRLLKRYPA